MTLLKSNDALQSSGGYFYKRRSLALVCAVVGTLAVQGQLCAQDAESEQNSAQPQRIKRHATPVNAQPMRMIGQPQIMSPHMNLDRLGGVPRSELERLQEDLQLTEDQMMLVSVLYEGLRDSLSEAAGEMENAGHLFSSIDHSDQAAMMEAIHASQKAQAEYSTTRKALITQFFEDVTMILSDEQNTHWPVYERGKYRRSTLTQRAHIAGEGVDLYKLTRKLELVERAPHAVGQIHMTLDRYADEIDGPLRARNHAIDAIDTPGNTLDVGALPDPAEMEESIDRISLHRYELVDVNMRYADLLTSTIGGNLGQEFALEFQQASYPRIYRATPADTYIKQVLGDETLEFDQRAQIDVIASGYTNSVGQLNSKIVSLERQKQRDVRPSAANKRKNNSDSGGAVAMTMFMGGDGGGNVFKSERGSDETEAALKDSNEDKRKLVENTINDIYAALGTGQQARLPKLSVPRNLHRGIFGNMGMSELSLGEGEMIWGGSDMDFNGAAIMLDIEDILGDINIGQLLEDSTNGIGQLEHIAVSEGEDGEQIIEMSIVVSGEEQSVDDETDTNEQTDTKPGDGG